MSIDRHLLETERLQRRLTAQLLASMSDLDAEDLLHESLALNIGDQVVQWIQENILDELEAEALRFDREMDGSATEEVIAAYILLLIGQMEARLRLTAQAVLDEISTYVLDRVATGADQRAVLQSEAIGRLHQSLNRKLEVVANAFVLSMASYVPQGEAALVWITVEDKRVCVDCGPRAGVIHSAAQWVELGLPRSGWSVCTLFCRCLLVDAVASRALGFEATVKRSRGEESA